MQSIRIVAGVATVMLWVGVALAQNVMVDYRQGMDFSGYKTFMWIKPPNTVNPLDQQRVIDQVNSALSTKGLRLVTGEADLCIAAHTATEQERTLNTFYDGFGGGWQWRGSGFGTAITTVSTYDVGTLVVDIFDSRMKEAIWRGTSMKTLSEKPERNAVSLNKAIAKMFENFPPAGARRKTSAVSGVSVPARGVKRTDLQRQDLTIPGREVVQTRIDLEPGALAQGHTHPGEELVYVLEGSLEYRVQGKAPVTLNAGDVLFIPAHTVHSAKNVGTGNGAELATYVVEKGKPLLVLAK